jgi:hypothetical protein
MASLEDKKKALDWSKRNTQGFEGILDVNQFLPVTGDIQSGIMAGQDLQKGNYGSAALNSLGLLPFIPALGGVIAKNIPSKTTFETAQETAQRNAALPVGEGGLGLPATNTAMDRARAMGFEDNWYHGRYSDYEQINPNKTYYATQDPSYASIYSVEPTASSMGGKSISDFKDLKPNVMPVMIRKNEILDTRVPSGKKVFDSDFYMKYGDATPLTEKKLPDWVEAEDFRDMFQDKNMKYKGVFADEGKIPTGEGGLRDRGVSGAIFDPSIVRSRFAAFDPFRRNEPDILAGVAAAPVGLLAVDKEKTKKKRSNK